MILDDCKGCKHKERCSGGPWYSYGEIFYCRKQMIFLIEHIVELGEGNWPPNPDGSSYIDPSLRSKSFRNEAYFCKPAGLVACVMGRLDRTGEDGITLMEDIHSGIREYRDLKSVAKRALNYISGYRKRKTSYTDWKSKQKVAKTTFKRKEVKMSKVWQEKLVEEFNRSFNEPFMPEGFYEARIGKDSRGERVLRIRLGDRDVAFDWLGNPIGSGSNVGSAITWEIGRRTESLPDAIDEG